MRNGRLTSETIGQWAIKPIAPGLSAVVSEYAAILPEPLPSPRCGSGKGTRDQGHPPIAVTCRLEPCVAVRRRSSLGRSRGSAPSALPLSRRALTRRCACRRAQDRRSYAPMAPADLLLRPHSRLVGHEGIALHRIRRHHDVVIQSLERIARVRCATTSGTRRRCSRSATCRPCPGRPERKLG